MLQTNNPDYICPLHVGDFTNGVLTKFTDFSPGNYPDFLEPPQKVVEEEPMCGNETDEQEIRQAEATEEEVGENIDTIDDDGNDPKTLCCEKCEEMLFLQAPGTWGIFHSFASFANLIYEVHTHNLQHCGLVITLITQMPHHMDSIPTILFTAARISRLANGVCARPAGSRMVVIFLHQSQKSFQRVAESVDRALRENHQTLGVRWNEVFFLTFRS